MHHDDSVMFDVKIKSSLNLGHFPYRCCFMMQEQSKEHLSTCLVNR